MIQHHIYNRWSALNAPMSHTILRMIRHHPSFIPRLIPMKMVTASSAVGYATIDGDKILVNPDPYDEHGVNTENSFNTPPDVS